MFKEGEFLLRILTIHCNIILGIPYLNLSEETKYKENLDEIQKIRANNLLSEPPQNNRIPIPKEDRLFINQIL